MRFVCHHTHTPARYRWSHFNFDWLLMNFFWFDFCRILATQETELQFIFVTCQQEEARTGVFGLAGRAEDVNVIRFYFFKRNCTETILKIWRGPFRNGRSQAKKKMKKFGSLPHDSFRKQKYQNFSADFFKRSFHRGMKIIIELKKTLIATFT